MADGYERAREGIREQVEAEYAQRLSKATPEERSRLKLQIEEEIERRMRVQAPRAALY